MANNYWNGMNNMPGFERQADGSYYNKRTGERYNPNGTINLTTNQGKNTVYTTDATQETAKTQIPTVTVNTGNYGSNQIAVTKPETDPYAIDPELDAYCHFDDLDYNEHLEKNEEEGDEVIF